MKSKRQGRRCIRRGLKALLKKRTRGGCQIYVLCLCCLLFVVILYRVLFDYARVQITHDMVDDALTTALVSACIYNMDEMALSGSAVIYDTVTRVPEPDETFSEITGGAPPEPEPYDTINDGALLAPGNDPYLNGCYERFLKNLKKNLKLDDDMTATISGIEGTVTVSEFAVFNKFWNLDAEGNPADFRIVKYTYAGGGWAASPYNVNQCGKTYNSLDHADYQVWESSISARITFEVVAGTSMDWASGPAEALTTTVSYQRVVDVIK